MFAPWKKSYDQPRQHIKKQRHYLANKDLFSQSYHFSIAMVMYWCESWTIKKAEHWRTECFWNVVLENTIESPLDCKEIQLVKSKGNQSWIFIKRTDAEAKTVTLGHLMQRTDLLDLPAIQGTLKSLLQHHSSKASTLQFSAFFMVQLSHPYMTSGKSIV